MHGTTGGGSNRTHLERMAEAHNTKKENGWADDSDEWKNHLKKQEDDFQGKPIFIIFHLQAKLTKWTLD